MTGRLALLAERVLAHFGLAIMAWCRHHWHRDEAPRGWKVPYWRCCWCGAERIGRPPVPTADPRGCRAAR